jgi:hypothetical protein
MCMHYVYGVFTWLPTRFALCTILFLQDKYVKARYDRAYIILMSYYRGDLKKKKKKKKIHE